MLFIYYLCIITYVVNNTRIKINSLTKSFLKFL